MKDRRSGIDRRNTPRNPVSIDVEWESSRGRHRGTVSDLSESGCFLLSGGDITDGETVRVFLPLDEGMKVEFIGIVTNSVFEIGFAVKFEKLTPAQRGMIYNLITFPVRT